MAGDIYNSQCIFVNLSSMRKLDMRQKKGPLGGPSWASPHQILGEKRIVAQEDRPAREPV